MKTLKTLIAEKNANVESLIGMIDAGRFANEFDLDDYLDDHFPEEVGMLARGSFGIVLIGDRDRPDWVLKKQQKEDKPYEAFLDIAQANRGRNPHFPKIRKRFSLDGAKFTIIEHVETDDVDITHRLEKVQARLEGRVPDYDFANWNVDTTEVFRALYPIWAGNQIGRNHDALFEGIAREFHTTTENLREFYRLVSPAGRWDLHASNLGLRKNGELVFFDPVAPWSAQ